MANTNLFKKYHSLKGISNLRLLFISILFIHYIITVQNHTLNPLLKFSSPKQNISSFILSRKTLHYFPRNIQVLLHQGQGSQDSDKLALLTAQKSFLHNEIHFNFSDIKSKCCHSFFGKQNCMIKITTFRLFQINLAEKDSENWKIIPERFSKSFAFILRQLFGSK